MGSPLKKTDQSSRRELTGDMDLAGELACLRREEITKKAQAREEEDKGGKDPLGNENSKQFLKKSETEFLEVRALTAGRGKNYTDILSLA